MDTPTPVQMEHKLDREVKTLVRAMGVDKRFLTTGRQATYYGMLSNKMLLAQGAIRRAWS